MVPRIVAGCQKQLRPQCASGVYLRRKKELKNIPILKKAGIDTEKKKLCNLHKFPRASIPPPKSASIYCNALVSISGLSTALSMRDS